MRARISVVAGLSLACCACGGSQRSAIAVGKDGGGRAGAASMTGDAGALNGTTAGPAGIGGQPPPISAGSMAVPTGPCLPCGNGCLACGGVCSCSSGAAAPVPWNPPFDHTGDPGWKDGSTPLCSGIDQSTGLDVWSDGSGVYVLVSGTGNPAATLGASIDEDAGAGPADAGGVTTSDQYGPRTAIWHDDGSGWKLQLERPGVAGAFALTGSPSGALLINDPQSATDPNAQLPPNLMLPGTITPEIPCSLGVAHGSTLDCLDLDPVQSVFAVDPQLAYAVMGGTRLLSYDGTQWHANAALIPYPVTALWADHDGVLAVGHAGTVLRLEQDGWVLDDPGTLEHITSVWGSARDDLWLGTSQGNIIHYDGMQWTPMGHVGGVTCSAVTPIRGIWGAGGTVYFYSDEALVRWNGSELESIGNWSCAVTNGLGGTTITGLWGNAPDEVFLTMLDPNRSGVDPCGVAFAVNFDGSTFHRM